MFVSIKHGIPEFSPSLSVLVNQFIIMLASPNLSF